MPQSQHTASWVPTSDEDKEQVRAQLNRLVDTHYFRNSRRYPALFRFLVEETLAGRGDQLKERLIGVHVFDRPADYDTAADPIVRVTIAEIRKRIAQYYHEDAHDVELRIEMSPGRYEPEFRLRTDPALEPIPVESTGETFQAGFAPLPAQPLALEPQGSAPGQPSAVPLVRPAKPPTRVWPKWAALAAGLAAALLAGSWVVKRPSALDEFWKPVFASRTPVTVCLAVPGRTSSQVSPGLGADRPSPSMLPSHTAPSPSFLAHETLGENVVFSDVLAALSLTNLLAAHGNASRLRMSGATTLDDLRQGPVVLIGGLDNPWTLRSVERLRFHFEDSGHERFRIVDERNLGNRDWTLDLTTDYDAVTHDFAIVARRHNSTTGQVEIIVAGIGMSGTAAAGEFLSSPDQMRALQQVVGKGFADQDFEAVLGTDVVNGKTGSPRILAVDVQ